MADLARHLDVGQEAHGQRAHALAFAGRAAAVAGVETEAPRRVAARARFQRVGKQLADQVPEAYVGGGAGARGLADGGLVHLEHAVDRLEALQAGAARQRRCAAGVHGVAPGLGGALADPGGHVGQQHFARQRGLARARDAGDGDQALQRDASVDLLQVVALGAQHAEPRDGSLSLWERAGVRVRCS